MLHFMQNEYMVMVREQMLIGPALPYLEGRS